MGNIGCCQAALPNAETDYKETIGGDRSLNKKKSKLEFNITLL